ncbi:fimbrial protein [Pantoea sp. SOD02]|uniref:fimbrial protein n=1 Tax=Pantoea sp. SOD02 TaxID=2970818 RepID=UPI0021580B57|nr:fimbrial protein [Pantoea sp. SOD02]UVC29325.1 fimbrial protein [Pantoea sp. SOD02]
MKRLFMLTIGMMLSLLFSPLSFAATDMTLHGTLINLTCKIGDEKPIDIDFGEEVVTDLIDGEHYLQAVPLQVACSQDYSGDLNFSVVGTASSFEPSALVTNVPGLGIQFLDASSNTPIELNKAYSHKNNDSVDLNVVPIKEASASLPGGAFTASAQLLVEPQ